MSKKSDIEKIVPFRAGDTVKHEPTGEEWSLACDEEDGKVLPEGWPMCSAKSKDCVIVERSSSAERLKTLQNWAESKSADDWRSITANRQIK